MIVGPPFRVKEALGPVILPEVRVLNLMYGIWAAANLVT
jgi:hypothetical protein